MKDKKIQYLLTLKRKFENIRHDQYIFSEKNPVNGSNQSENTLLKLYQLINFSLQSIEFKSILQIKAQGFINLLETVNMSYKKPKNENSSSVQNQEKDGYPQVNKMKILDNQQQIKNLSMAQTMADNSNQYCIEITNSREINQNKFHRDQHKENIEKPNYNKDNQQRTKNDGKIKKKIVVPFQSKFQKQTLQKEQSVKQDIIINNDFQLQKDCLQSDSKKKLRIDQSNDQKQNSTQYQSQQKGIIQNDINSNFIQNSIQQYDLQLADVGQNLVDEENNEILFSDIPQFLQCVQNYNNVEIQQLFTDEKEDQLKIYDSQIKYMNDLNNQNDKKMRNSERNNSIKKDEKMYTDTNDDQNGIDEYLNFETPKKMTNDFYEESEIEERYVVSNTLKKFNVDSSFKASFVQQVENNNYENNQDEEMNDQLSKTKNLIRMRRQNNIKQMTNSNEQKTVQRISNFKSIIDNSDQTKKYRFCEVTTEKKRQPDLQQYSADKVETEIKQKSFVSNKKTCQSNSNQIIINTSNKKISKKLDFKQDEDYKSYVRGPYNFYSEELKKKAIKDYFKYKDLKKAAEMNEVKVKNLKRWIAVGHKRKEGKRQINNNNHNQNKNKIKGGGRKKEDPDMEEKVYEWLQDKYYKEKESVTRNEIREIALAYSNKKEKFKASKGWLEKFFLRYNCKFMSQQDKHLDNEDEDNHCIEFNLNIQ